MAYKVLHKRSNQTQGGGAKLPSASTLDYGEVAINYHDGTEKLFIKNDNSEIVSFRSDNQLPPVEKHENQEFVYRQAVNTNEAKSLELTRIYGKTLAWNQQISSYVSGTYYGLTIVPDSNGSFNISGTVTNPPMYGQCVIATCGQPQMRDGRKYLIRFKNNGNYEIGLTGYGSWASSIIWSATNETTWGGSIFLRVSDGMNVSISGLRVEMIDLTLMFGRGNEPTIEEYEALYPEFGHSYNLGKLISNDVESIETVGFNLWDEEWRKGTVRFGVYISDDAHICCKNAIPVQGGQTLYFKAPSGLGTSGFSFQDANGNNIGEVVAVCPNTTISVPSNAALMWFYVDMGYGTTYNHDICINLSDSSKNGTYELYRKSAMQLGLGSFQVRDSQGNVTTITGGLKSAGSICDEIVGTKLYRRVRRETGLKDKNWTYNGSVFYTMDMSDIQRTDYTASAISNIVSSRYVANSPAVSVDKTICTSNDSDILVIRDSAYSDASTFKASLDGFVMDYALKNVEVYELVTPLVSSVKAGTTEERISPNSDGLSAPMVADVSYTQGYEYILGEVSSQLGDVQSILQTI